MLSGFSFSFTNKLKFGKTIFFENFLNGEKNN